MIGNQWCPKLKKRINVGNIQYLQGFYDKYENKNDDFLLLFEKFQLLC